MLRVRRIESKVDEAAAIIRGYLAHPSCSLQTLSLRSADVDDDECCFLMEAISRNQSLTKLDVSGELVGVCKQEGHQPEPVAHQAGRSGGLSLWSVLFNETRKISDGPHLREGPVEM